MRFEFLSQFLPNGVATRFLTFSVTELPELSIPTKLPSPNIKRLTCFEFLRNSFYTVF